MDAYVTRKPDPTIEFRRQCVNEKIEFINDLPGWNLDRTYIQSLSIRQAEEAVECVFVVDDELQSRELYENSSDSV